MLEKVRTIIGASKVEANAASLACLEKMAKQDLEIWLASVGGDDLQIEWSAEYLTLYGCNTAFNNQNGYVGDALVKSSWEQNWFVIGDIHGDPIILDTATLPNRIFFARHGLGKWNPMPLASDIRSFEKSLEVWCNAYYLEFNRNILDEDFEVSQNFKDFLAKELTNVLTEEEVHSFIFVISG